MTLLSVALGTASALFGLGASYALDWPSGATIILVQCLAFGLCLAAGLLRRTA
jgi:zinc transport system permease protein